MSSSTQDPVQGTMSTAAGGASGLQSILAGATALAGLFTAIRPTSAVAQALTQALPTVGGYLPPLIAACATVVAAFSHPPRWIKRP
jgi:hypothetical protein